MPQKNMVAASLRRFLNGNNLNLTNADIDVAISGELREADMTDNAFPCLGTLAANAPTLARTLVSDLQNIEVGLRLNTSTDPVQVQSEPTGINVPGLMPPLLLEPLNSFLKFGGTQEFQAWKTLVDLLRLIKGLEQ